jgi:hypothetical protein
MWRGFGNMSGHGAGWDLPYSEAAVAEASVALGVDVPSVGNDDRA